MYFLLASLGDGSATRSKPAANSSGMLNLITKLLGLRDDFKNPLAACGLAGKIAKPQAVRTFGEEFLSQLAARERQTISLSLRAKNQHWAKAGCDQTTCRPRAS